MRAEGAKKMWVQKDENDKNGAFFLADVIFISPFSDRSAIFILLLCSSSFFKQSVIFNLNAGTQRVRGGS